MDVKIEVYVMHPSNERWMENSEKREDIENLEVYENQKKQMEFPNPADGFEAIFEHRQLLESMNTRPFWHYCEVCGKKEFITAKEALDAGWDYPPHFGEFGLLGPRTCGNCSLKDTLF